MGCGATAGELKSARAEVDALKRKVEAIEGEKGALASEKGALQLRLDVVAREKAEAATAPPPAEVPKPRVEELPKPEPPPKATVADASVSTDAPPDLPPTPEPQPPAPAVEIVVEQEPQPQAPQAAVAEAVVEQEQMSLPGAVVAEGGVPDAPSAAPPEASRTPSPEPSEGGQAPEAKATPQGSVGYDASTCEGGVAEQPDPDRLICNQCLNEAPELFTDSDLNRYCQTCWTDYYGTSPQHVAPPVDNLSLVPVEIAEFWAEDQLAHAWSQQIMPGWPPLPAKLNPSIDDGEGEIWSNVAVRVRRDVVGPHAREATHGDRPHPGETLMGRYRCNHVVGEGHFTKAYLAEDLMMSTKVCLKRHRNLSVEALADLLVLGRRMEQVDPAFEHFPKLVDSFYDLVGYTVESLVEGRNCLAIANSDPRFYREGAMGLANLRVVARGALQGLALLDQAGIVHNDVKPDNLIWVEAPSLESGAQMAPKVQIVDFGCARLDQREEPGRNWSLAEGGAGHLGKWPPEMTLRLPITNRGDIWGVAISLCELHCGRAVWRTEADTAEVVLAQSIGLCNMMGGVPASLLRRSPLDIRQLYTPGPLHMPLRRGHHGRLEVLRPTRWGLDQVLGEHWRDAASGKADLGALLEAALIVDPADRPSAGQLLEECVFAGPDKPEPQPAEVTPESA